ncbi:MAG: acyl carrier protein [Omnitrophica WOR_2 bacterium GWF2_38_59]|nr:MAG: acyl carrier protein [Omnitrophica WOR_2 bacterium GWF2_38_59]OGX48224.1 MAG: acyl carrier protein [Omnitrophica WOR_2 bacterium RIFOXYA2_FULL_38_17]OGX53301.1 MAG: acyl carrier protein [Omnitrophica WOR_2 bacterium RIFOXYA12_FULL_38_10]OGX59611.1 MAG: acyl carrier protein [Omnitrophica WOR_2 bacterium RIFOXYC2_FULL_38_12]OGX60003.1 MAG: acyl carrier protein [Omnitrophica WOR_2 bacterium RIFOXYB2_FULL_38_16]
MDIKERLNKVFKDVFDDDSLEINETMTAEDVDMWDSLMHITLIVAIEREFGIKFNTSDVNSLENVGSLIEKIKERS